MTWAPARFSTETGESFKRRLHPKIYGRTFLLSDWGLRHFHPPAFTKGFLLMNARPGAVWGFLNAKLFYLCFEPLTGTLSIMLI